MAQAAAHPGIGGQEDVPPAPDPDDLRDEVLAIVDSFFPNLLNRGEFRTVATVLRELRALGGRVGDGVVAL